MKLIKINPDHEAIIKEAIDMHLQPSFLHQHGHNEHLEHHKAACRNLANIIKRAYDIDLGEIDDTDGAAPDFIYLITRAPRFCPNCGHEFAKLDRYANMDFYGHASHTCPKCHAKYQYASEPTLLALAGNDGDMPRFILEQ